MKKSFSAAVAVAVLMASRAYAAPVTVSAGDFLTFNFDLRGETPAPPYALASMITNVSGLDFAPPPCGGPGGLCDLLDIGEWRFWTELNGTGSLFQTAAVNLATLFHSEMTDGVFSATLQMTEGSIVVDPVACGIARIAPDGERTPGCGPPEPPPSVPEPSALSLLASAGAVAMLRRLRRVPPKRQKEDARTLTVLS